MMPVHSPPPDKNTTPFDFTQLPEMAQQELMMFHEFLVFKYRKYKGTCQRDQQHILRSLFDDTHGKLPVNYIFNREELHERKGKNADVGLGPDADDS